VYRKTWAQVRDQQHAISTQLHATVPMAVTSWRATRVTDAVRTYLFTFVMHSAQALSEGQDEAIQRAHTEIFRRNFTRFPVPEKGKYGY
jgi:hypothetical protein